MRTVKLTKESTKDILENLLKRSPNNYGKFESTVAQILDKVKNEGDAALFAEHFPDRHKVAGRQRITEQDVELVKVAPCSDPAVEVGVDRRGHKVVGDVHGDLPQVFPQPFQHDTHHAGGQVHVGRVVKEIEGAGAVEFQGRCHTAGLRLRLLQKLLVQVLEQGRLAVPDPQGHIPVDEPHTAVNHGFFDGLQAVLAAHHQLTQGQQKIRFHGKRAFVIVQVKLDVHGVNVAGRAGGDLDHLPAQPPHQGRVFAHGIDNQNPILWDGEEHV